MERTHDKWERINALADRLGVKYDARRKWLRRGVPHRWRLPLIEASGGYLTPDDFAALPDGGAS